MSSEFIRCRCPKCRARIRAPQQLVGIRRKCPSCAEPFVVASEAPKDQGPLLVLREKGDYYAIEAI